MKSGSWNFKEYCPWPILKPHEYVVLTKVFISLFLKSEWVWAKPKVCIYQKPSAYFKAGGFLFLNIKIYFRGYYLLKEGIYNA